MKVIIREGSAARNFDALIGLLNDWPDSMMFCSDDKHPDSLVLGHINQLCARAVAKGVDVFKVLKAACVNPVLHYKPGVGLLRPGDPADFILVKDLVNFEVIKTYINGELVAENGQSLIVRKTEAGMNADTKPVNNFTCESVHPSAFHYPKPAKETIEVIEALDGQLITNKLMLDIAPLLADNNSSLVSNTQKDVLKIVVVNRYRQAKPAVAFIKNTGLEEGAIASSVAHDSHNIVAVGVDDDSISRAVNLVIEKEGGVSAVSSKREMILPLPVAGLMSMEDGYKVAADYTAIDEMTKKELGSTLSSPFMTLSFMALLVIPHLKLSDLGLFDGDSFSFV